MTTVPLRATRLAAPGRPTTLVRMPLVIAAILVMALGVAGVLFLNTKIDESGMRTEQARSSAAQLRLQIEELDRTIASLQSTPHLAQRARALGMVPAGDAAMIVIRPDGEKPTVIGDPAPVSGATAQGTP